MLAVAFAIFIILHIFNNTHFYAMTIEIFLQIPAGTRYPKPNTSLDDPGAKSVIVDPGGSKLPAAGAAPCTCLENVNLLKDKKITTYYNVKEASGGNKMYGSYDSSKEILKFTGFAASFCLLFSSIYLFNIAWQRYRHYFDKDGREIRTNALLMTIIFTTNLLFIPFVVALKGLPMDLIIVEFINYPNQFILSFIISSLLLLFIGTFRLSLVAFTGVSGSSKQKIQERRGSKIGLIFGLVALLADLIAIGTFIWKFGH